MEIGSTQVGEELDGEACEQQFATFEGSTSLKHGESQFVEGSASTPLRTTLASVRKSFPKRVQNKRRLHLQRSILSGFEDSDDEDSVPVHAFPLSPPEVTEEVSTSSSPIALLSPRSRRLRILDLRERIEKYDQNDSDDQSDSDDLDRQGSEVLQHGAEEQSNDVKSTDDGEEDPVTLEHIDVHEGWQELEGGGLRLKRVKRKADEHPPRGFTRAYFVYCIHWIVQLAVSSSWIPHYQREWLVWVPKERQCVTVSKLTGFRLLISFQAWLWLQC